MLFLNPNILTEDDASDIRWKVERELRTSKRRRKNEIQRGQLAWDGARRIRGRK
jgi:hypothetical protein